MTGPRVLLVLIVLFANANVGGQESDYERILLPLAVDNVPGAFGSVWRSELWVTSAEPGIRDFQADEYCVTLCPPFGLSMSETRRVDFSRRPSSAPGMVVLVQRPSDRVGFNLRIQDMSRQALTWGTQIPVVRENDLVSGMMRFINIPMDPRFRHMLRFYALTADSPASLRVAVLDRLNRTPIVVREIALVPLDSSPHTPFYAQIADLFEVMPAFDNVLVEVTPLSPGFRYWGFMSVTNNETQHVTTITPAIQ